MKTFKVIPTLLFAVMFIFLTGFSSRAITPATANLVHLQKAIKETLRYPEQAIKSGCTGTVNVIFTIDEKGKIDIKKTFSDNPEIAKIVKEQLSSVCCKEVKTLYNQHYKEF